MSNIRIDCRDDFASYEACRKALSYLLDYEVHHFIESITNGFNPEDHIFYSAAVAFLNGGDGSEETLLYKIELFLSDPTNDEYIVDLQKECRTICNRYCDEV